jgi:PAS domain S-box-containing protein
MKTKMTTRPLSASTNSEVERLRLRLAELEETVQAIRKGHIDALVVSSPAGDQVFTLQGAEKPYRLLIEAINEGALTILHDGTVLYCNNRFAAMVQHPIEKIIGSSFYSFLPPDQKDRLRRILASIRRNGAKHEFALRSPSREAHALPIQLSLAPLEIDGTKAIGIIATDLSERKLQEQILRNLNEALEQRVLERTAEVTSANQALEEAQGRLRCYTQDLENKVAERTAALEQSVKSLELFCYTIAHDLRAPLRAMSGFTTTLLDDFGKLLPQEGHDYARRIANAAERMDHLIRDLLAYGKINSVNLPLTDTPPAPIIEEFASSSEGKHATIRIDSPLPPVVANPTALDQVLKNLLSNAVKFVAPGKRPEIRVFAHEPKPGWTRICVQDNGIGIEPHYHDRIFRVFERLSASSYPGTGIGLAIVQKAMERMGGQVGIESSPGKGSCFWIELPKP